MKLSITTLLNIRRAALLKSVWRWYNPFNKGLGICLRQSYLDLQIQDKTLSIVLTELMKKKCCRKRNSYLHMTDSRAQRRSGSELLCKRTAQDIQEHSSDVTNLALCLQLCQSEIVCVCVCTRSRSTSPCKIPQQLYPLSSAWFKVRS